MTRLSESGIISPNQMAEALQEQLGLFAPRRGGMRVGAGRKPAAGKRARVAHRRRPRLSRHHPVHAVLRVREDVTNLRGPAFSTLLHCFKQGRARPGFRLVHFSVQSNHLHFIIEADDAPALARGMQALAIRIARNLNQILDRHGQVFEDHYFAAQMKSPAQVRHTLRYVFRNDEHHAGRALPGQDPRASEPYFGLAELPPDAPVAAAQTWLLTVGFRRERGKSWPGPAS